MIIKKLEIVLSYWMNTHQDASIGSGFLTTRNMYKTHVISLSSKFAIRILKPVKIKLNYILPHLWHLKGVHREKKFMTLLLESISLEINNASFTLLLMFCSSIILKWFSPLVYKSLYIINNKRWRNYSIAFKYRSLHWAL